jgi:hypothetical protein
LTHADWPRGVSPAKGCGRSAFRRQVDLDTYRYLFAADVAGLHAECVINAPLSPSPSGEMNARSPATRAILSEFGAIFGIRFRAKKGLSERRGVLVFISYNTLDLGKAQALAATLAMRRPGNEWFLARRAITGGAWWVPKLGDTMARADAVLFLAGNEIGPWQQLEYYEALRLSRERGGRPRLIPVVIAERSPGLPFFAQLHQIVTADPAARETLDAIERALDDSLPPNAAPAWQRFQPYKGLPALDEADAAFFFGRDEETATILDLMARHPDRIIALIGQSGVGKSSLAFAGVLARLKSQLWPLQIGEWPAGLRDSRAFLPLVIRPGEKPLKELALAFARLYCKKSFELDEEAAGWGRRFVEGSGLQDLLRATRDKLAEALIAAPPRSWRARTGDC